MQPFLKWAGGKRWLFDESFLGQIPPFERYVEPFLGGGAGFFALQPSCALLSDLNQDLISLYEVMRDHPKELGRLMEKYQKRHSNEFYYTARGKKPQEKIQAAAWMLYLNRTCWNGLYRLNARGEFNVPIGTKTMVTLETDDFSAVSKMLAGVQICACDFQQTIDKTGAGDLLFVDPPYTVKHNMNGFIKYNELMFSWSDQVRLRDTLFGAVTRGASIILMNANHDSIRSLYEGFGIHSEMARRSVISGKPVGRSKVTELMVRA